MFEDYFISKEQEIIRDLGNSIFPHTSQALLSYYLKSKSIDNVIQSIDFDLDYYPCTILIRSQIEHFIVAAYIWIQYRLKENDEIARTYHEEYLIYEVIKRINYSKSNNINMSSRYSIAFKKILDLLTENKIVNQKDFEQLNIKANQFDIRQISKFFELNLPLEFDNVVKNERIKQFLEYYNYLSSFVHGGPSADALIKEEHKSKFIKEASEFVEWSSNILSIHRLFIIYFLAINNNIYKGIINEELEKL